MTRFDRPDDDWPTLTAILEGADVVAAGTGPMLPTDLATDIRALRLLLGLRPTAAVVAASAWLAAGPASADEPFGTHHLPPSPVRVTAIFVLSRMTRWMDRRWPNRRQQPPL